MIAAIVLAAGASERMGQAKADLQMPGGTSFLESILTTLRRLRVPAWVVVGPDDRRAAPPGAELVVNPDPSRGMLSSLQCGLRALPPGTGAVIVWPVDHPRVEPGTIATLIAAQRAHGAPVVLPRKDGRRGHPVVFAGGALEELAGLPDTLLPQLEEWAKYYYVVDGPPTREETTVAGLPATEWTYPIRIRPKDPQSKVTYWVVRRATRLFIIRAAFAARALGKDEPALRGIVDGWEFL